MGSPIIFSGNDAKLLKSNLDFFGQNKILAGTVDPSSAATSANPGSLYLNSSTGVIYVKQDSGLTTNWKQISVDVSLPTLVAGENVSAGDSLYVSVGAADGARTAGRVYKLDATNDNRIEFIGMAATAATTGQNVLIKLVGQISLAGLTLGRPVFASVTAPGAVQVMAPTVVGQWIVQVGTALSSTLLEVNAANSATALKITNAGGSPLNSVGLSMPAEFSVANSPLTANGTLAVTKATQTANMVYAGPITGAAAPPAFRMLTASDVNSNILQLFGDGSDSNVTISSGTTTLIRDMYYSNLTINGTGQLATAGFKVFVQNTLDLTAAPANAIINLGGNGGASAAAAGGTAGIAAPGVTVGVSSAGIVGAAGSVAAGVQAGTSATPAAPANGGACGAGGAGGAGASGAGGALRAAVAPSTPFSLRRAVVDLLRSATTITSAVGGPGGSSGGGDTTNTSFGGGGGGGGGGIVYVSARIVNRSGSTAAGAVSAKGGNGGNAGTVAVVGNQGGSGGGAGGGGGYVYFMFDLLTGTAATNMLDATGGNGGNASNGKGTGIGGNGGSSGAGGRITLVNLGAITISETLGGASVTGTAGSGVTGGAGATATTFRVSV